MHCGFNRSMQHLISKYREEDVADEAETEDLLFKHSEHSQAHLNKVARQLNERPRKILGFYSPAEKFGECVASAG